jgi:hypothetical protein
MVNFKASFSELKKPMVWLHYALGTAGIIGVFLLLMKYNILTTTSSIWMYGVAFWLCLVVIDRIIHRVLFNAPFSELKNPILLLHYSIDTVGMVGIWTWLMNMGYLTPTTNIWVMSVVFLAIYVLVDRSSHAILNLR